MEKTTAVATQNNLQLIQEGYRDFATGNIQGIINNCADDVIWSSYKVPDLPATGTFYGKEGVQEYFIHIAQQLNVLQFEPKEFIVQGENVVVLGHQRATVKSTGKTFEHDWCMSFKVREGKVRSCFVFLDSLDIAQAFK